MHATSGARSPIPPDSIIGEPVSKTGAPLYPPTAESSSSKIRAPFSLFRNPLESRVCRVRGEKTSLAVSLFGRKAAEFLAIREVAVGVRVPPFAPKPFPHRGGL